MSKFAALAAVLALAVVVPTASAYELPLGTTYDLPDDLLAFIAATPPDRDFAVGSGRFDKGQPADRFNISARGSAADANGHVRFEDPDLGVLTGEVDCLSVIGNTAGVSGHLDNPPDELSPRFVVGIEDNGEPSGGTPDRALLIFHTEELIEPQCGLGNLLSITGRDILQGNLVVKSR